MDESTFKVRSKETAPLREAIMGEASLMRTSKLSVITNSDATVLVSTLPFWNHSSDVVIPSRVVPVRVFSLPPRDYARVTTNEPLGRSSALICHGRMNESLAYPRTTGSTGTWTFLTVSEFWPPLELSTTGCGCLAPRPHTPVLIACLLSWKLRQVVWERSYALPIIH
ncbi:hypothetical protein BDV41DRAFT_529190 [Aspergillus transmontanensis]|uniref:Uncharacterized protein n=1 Tax=Aspergillus transmontanensis TaxID=1034304 RepID=A0A5N6W5P0_9EURO|nr:hypothetical protein BDV41DRAFT_529190 [Aspergillus transmontanensis]